MRRFRWVMVATLCSPMGCGGSPGVDFVPGQPDARDAHSDALVTGSGGSAGASPDSATEAGASGAGGSAGASPDAAPDTLSDAGSDTYIAPDSGSDAHDGASEAAAPEGGDAARDVRIDSAPDALPDAGLDTRQPEGGDALPDSIDVQSDATDGGLPPTCDYVVEPVPDATWPHALCGTTVSAPGGTYQFTMLRLRQPFSNPTPIEPFTGGTMTVRNGSSVKTYNGVSWQTTMGEEIAFRGPGDAAIVFTTGVQEISVTTTDKSGKVGCLPQPCTWTITQ